FMSREGETNRDQIHKHHHIHKITPAAHPPPGPTLAGRRRRPQTWWRWVYEGGHAQRRASVQQVLLLLTLRAMPATRGRPSPAPAPFAGRWGCTGVGKAARSGACPTGAA